MLQSFYRSMLIATTLPRYDVAHSKSSHPP
jgi:hypothetical protein